jgi:hypothetical protein
LELLLEMLLFGNVFVAWDWKLSTSRERTILPPLLSFVVGLLGCRGSAPNFPLFEGARQNSPSVVFGGDFEGAHHTSPSLSLVLLISLLLFLFVFAL